MDSGTTATEPSSFQSPITKQKFCDPVIAEDGYTYEKDAIVTWLKTNNNSPMTKQPLDVNILIPNRLVKQLMDENFETTLRKQGYQFKLDDDVKQGDQLFVKYGKSVDAAEWIKKLDGPPIVLLTIQGARAVKEALFYVDMSKHANIVRTYGLVDNPHDDVMLVQERAKNGDLLQLLRRREQPPNDFVLKEIFIQIADGMSFLAHNNVVHGDLACRNILVFEFDEQNPKRTLVKVTDFGLSRGSDIYKSTSTSGSSTLNVIPYRYVAPEVLENPNMKEIYTEKSDMYSMGVLMWETYSPRGKQPWSHITDDREVMRRVIKGERLQKPAICSQAMWGLIQTTMSQQPNDRPTFAALNRQLIELYIKNDVPRSLSYNIEKALKEIKENNTTINLSETGLCDEEMKTIAEELKKNESVRQLNLNDNRLTDAGAIAIAEMLEVNKTINEVVLNWNKISSEGAKQLARVLTINTTLISLKINNNPLNDEGIQGICEALKTNETLQTLCVHGTQISAIGVKLIAEMLHKSSTLKTLIMGSNNIDDDGAIIIAEALKKNTSLTRLNMHSLQVTDKGAFALAEAIAAHQKRIFYFFLIDDPPISDKGREAIKASLRTNADNNNNMTSLFPRRLNLSSRNGINSRHFEDLN